MCSVDRSCLTLYSPMDCTPLGSSVHGIFQAKLLEQAVISSSRKEKKAATEGEMIVWQHRLKGRELEQTMGDSEGQGSLACCSPWGHKELDMTW